MDGNEADTVEVTRRFSGSHRRWSWSHGWPAAVPLHHVTSVRNRRSIARYGLAWRRMGAAPGIAGSQAPEVDGCFLAEGGFDTEYFVQMNNTGGPVDVEEVSGVDVAELVDSQEGYNYLPAVVPTSQLRLIRRDIPVGGEGRPGRPVYLT